LEGLTKMKKVFFLDIKEFEPLLMVMSGKPYFLIVDTEENDDYIATMQDNFDISMVFDWIKMYAKENEKFKEQLVDFVIDLSKEC